MSLREALEGLIAEMRKVDAEVQKELSINHRSYLQYFADELQTALAASGERLEEPCGCVWVAEKLCEHDAQLLRHGGEPTPAPEAGKWDAQNFVQEWKIKQHFRNCFVSGMESAIATAAFAAGQQAAQPTEQLAQWMIDHCFSTGHGDTFADLLKELHWQVVELLKGGG